MRERWLIALLAVSVNSAGQVAEPSSPTGESLASVSERLAAVETLRGSFDQTREIAALSRPLRSRGRFIVSELGLYWEQREPFAILLIATPDGMLQRVADQPAIRVSAAEQPIALSISQVFLGIFRGDHNEIDRYFDVLFDGNGDSWIMQLSPKAFPLTEAIDTIEIEGKAYIERLRIHGAAGDLQTIEFSEQRSEPPKLSEAERALYLP